MSPWKSFCEKWKGGCDSSICGDRGTRIVLARGKIPCDVLFVGEAPGESENALGLPFVGPAGKLLDRIIGDAVPPQLRIAFTNLVCCIPREEYGGKAMEPDIEDIRSCRDRLREFVTLCKPRLIVRVGKLATKHVKDDGCVDIAHPAAILRANVANQGLMIQKCVVTLSNAVEDL